MTHITHSQPTYSCRSPRAASVTQKLRFGAFVELPIHADNENVFV